MEKFGPTLCNISIETVPLVNNVKYSISVEIKYNFHFDSSLEIDFLTILKQDWLILCEIKSKPRYINWI